MLRLPLRLFWCSTPSIPSSPPPSSPAFASIIHSRSIRSPARSLATIRDIIVALPAHLLFLIFFAGGIDPRPSIIFREIDRMRVTNISADIYSNRYEVSAGEIKISCRLCFPSIVRVFIYLFIFYFFFVFSLEEIRHFFFFFGKNIESYIS